MANGSDGVDMIFAIMFAIVLGAAMLPTAFNTWFNTSTSSWGAGSAALWTIVPLVAIGGIAYTFYRKYV